MFYIGIKLKGYFAKCYDSYGKKDVAKQYFTVAMELEQKL